MGWNYRIVEILPNPENAPLTTPYYGFITAWYSKSQKLDSWSLPPAAPYGYSLAELKGDISYFMRAFEKDLLFNSDFGVEFGPPCEEVPKLVIHRTTYPKRDNAPSDDPPEEDFHFMIVGDDGVEKRFQPAATSIDLLRKIVEEMEKVVTTQQTLTT